MVFFVLVFMDASLCFGQLGVRFFQFKLTFPSIFFLFLKEHQTYHSLPLIMPIILPSYGERASEMLITQLTKNYKATVMLNDVSSDFDLIDS